MSRSDGFLRGYDDGIGDDLRQGLFAVASELVGSRRGEQTTKDRAHRIRSFGVALTAGSFPMRWRMRGDVVTDRSDAARRVAALS